MMTLISVESASQRDAMHRWKRLAARAERPMLYLPPNARPGNRIHSEADAQDTLRDERVLIVRTDGRNERSGNVNDRSRHIPTCATFSQ